MFSLLVAYFLFLYGTLSCGSINEPFIFFILYYYYFDPFALGYTLALQNATECLAAFVLGGKEELLAWRGDSGLTMKSLLNAASR